jgi:hypothetical protein
MIIYQFRESDRVYIGSAEVPDSPYLPAFSTLQPPPEKDGFYAVMRDGWVLVEGELPSPPPFVPCEPADPADTVRAERDAKLTASDWTQLADAPVDDLVWAVYRQALRDVPQQEGFPLNVVWPEPPVSAT